jgi:dolichyl-phosphate beta-glucosyltransferase
MTHTTIVVPCHNEAQRLRTRDFREFVVRHPGISFLFVNDGSTDRTGELLNEIAAGPKHFSALHLARNSGKAEAVRQGVLAATQGSSGYIGYWDADLATPLSAIPRFISALDRLPQIAIVLGTRLQLAGHDIRRKPIRRMLGKLFSRVTGLVLGMRLHDTQCGAKLFRNTESTRAAFSQPFGSRWIFDVELLARLSMLEGSAKLLYTSIYELPLDHWQDVAGSKLRRGDFVKAIGELRAIWWRYLRPGAPEFVAAETITSPEIVGPARRAA